MRKGVVSAFIIVLFILGGIFWGLTGGHQKSIPSNVSPKSTVTDRPVISTPAATQTTTGTPITLSIPSINLQASVESVGMDAQGNMDVPRTNDDVAWYNLGFKPGEKGSAVIDGHYDTVTGAPAVFWDISKLKNGDQIKVTDADGSTYHFQVTNVEVYPFNQVPLEQIFNSRDKSRLNLITCGGTWNQASKNYSN